MALSIEELEKLRAELKNKVERHAIGDVFDEIRKHSFFEGYEPFETNFVANHFSLGFHIYCQQLVAFLGRCVDSETKRIQKEKEEAERLQKEREKAERIQKEKEEAERLQKEREKAERLQKEREKAERIQKEREKAERIQKEREKAERIQKEKEEAERIQKEEKKTGIPQKEQEEEERKRKKTAYIIFLSLLSFFIIFASIKYYSYYHEQYKINIGKIKAKEDSLRNVHQKYLQDSIKMAKRLKLLTDRTDRLKQDSIKTVISNLVPKMIEIEGQNYLLAETEVTQALWEVVMGYNPSYFNNSPKHPVEIVSYEDVDYFLEYLNQILNENYELPTKELWLKAAKGRKENFKYVGSNILDDVGWFDKNSDKQTHPVGDKKGNDYGLYDMSGNVAEWVQKVPNSSYPYRAYGGSWYASEKNCTNDSFFPHTVDARERSIGFRLCKPKTKNKK